MQIKPAVTSLIAGTLVLWLSNNTVAENLTGDVVSNARIDIRYDQGRVDITAENAPLAAVVAKLSVALNVPMEIKGSSRDLVTLQLRGMTVESILKSLSRSVITIYDNSGKKLKKAIFIASAASPQAEGSREVYTAPEAPAPYVPEPNLAPEPSQTAQPEGWIDPPATGDVPVQTWVGEP